jgi:hypothetical protein
MSQIGPSKGEIIFWWQTEMQALDEPAYKAVLMMATLSCIRGPDRQRKRAKDRDRAQGAVCHLEDPFDY